MSKTVRNLALFGGTIIVLSFVVFVVNQTARVVQLASAFDPRAGQVVLAGLVGTYAVLVAVPVFMMIRLTRPLVPPESRDGPEYLAHLERLRARLRLNPYHAIKNLEGEAGMLQSWPCPTRAFIPVLLRLPVDRKLALAAIVPTPPTSRGTRPRRHEPDTAPAPRRGSRSSTATPSLPG